MRSDLNEQETNRATQPALTPRDLVEALEELLSLRHFERDGGRWAEWTACIERVDKALLQLSYPEMRSALDLILGLLNALVENDGIRRPEEL